MNITDIITAEIVRMVDESEGHVAEIRRNELARLLGCVPSQITYVLASRFTPEHGYIIESRRGGGGYIRVTRVTTDRSSALMHIINAIGDTLDEVTERVLLDNCRHGGLLDERSARLIGAATGGTVMREVPVGSRDTVRAASVKQMLISLM